MRTKKMAYTRNQFSCIMRIVCCTGRATDVHLILSIELSVNFFFFFATLVNHHKLNYAKPSM